MELPRARSRPAAMAAKDPKFRLSESNWVRKGSEGSLSRRISRQRSGLPSTTKTTSNSPATLLASLTNSARRERLGAQGRRGQSLAQDLEAAVGTAIPHEDYFELPRNALGELHQFGEQSIEVRLILEIGRA